jgi:Glycosyl hydrolases family 32 C terminal
VRNLKLRLRILADWSSVEVFTQEGHRDITIQVFPSDTSQAINLVADGGTVNVDALVIYQMRSIWPQARQGGEVAGSPPLRRGRPSAKASSASRTMTD